MSLKLVLFAGRKVGVVPDGLTLQGADGRLYEVFCPRWWQVIRWLSWWFSPRLVRGVIKIASMTDEVEVRVREVAP